MLLVLAAGILTACFLILARPLRPRAAMVGALIITVVFVIGPRLTRNRLPGILDLR